MQETFYTVPGCPVRIALVSDLHGKPFDKVLASLRARRPQLICVPGDFILGALPKESLKAREGRALSFFEACAGLAPCFVSLGNHEWTVTDGDIAVIGETGVQLLLDTYTVFSLDGARLVIGGLSSAQTVASRRLSEKGVDFRRIYKLTHRVGLSPPKLRWLDAFCAEAGYHILLSHHPEYYPRYLRYRGIELILSGHAHGGQVRVFGQGLYAPGQGIFPALTGGVIDGRLVISRGLANCQRVPRLFNPPEIVYIEG